MKIKNHLLYGGDGTQFPLTKTPNTGGRLDPRFLIIHYTAGRSAESSIDWFANRNSKASAHLVIGRDGSITQLAPLNIITWHAGKSSWAGDSGLNRFSIGIELDNAGKLERHGERWRAWFGGLYDDEQVIEATHKNGTRPYGWHIYTQAQLEACVEVSRLLVEKYNLIEVLGHDDISPFRKWDPGPAFPMESFRSKVMGRAESEPDVYMTTVNLNIRQGPGTHFSKIEGGPLPKGSRVEVLQIQGYWRFVDVLIEVNGDNDLQGWVHGRYLAKG